MLAINYRVCANLRPAAESEYTRRWLQYLPTHQYAHAWHEKLFAGRGKERGKFATGIETGQFRPRHVANVRTALVGNFSVLNRFDGRRGGVTVAAPLSQSG